MTIYELTEEYERIEELLDTIDQMKANGEDGLDDFEAETKKQFGDLIGAIGDKMDNVGRLIANLEAQREARAAEAKRLKESADSIGRRIDYLKNVLVKPIIQATEDKKIHGDIFSFSLRKSEAVNIIDEEKIPDDYKTQKITILVSKTEIKKAIKAGAVVPGAEVVENQSVQVK